MHGRNLAKDSWAGELRIARAAVIPATSSDIVVGSISITVYFAIVTRFLRGVRTVFSGIQCLNELGRMPGLRSAAGSPL